MKKLDKMKGITLIALIVTIIVLLILAGISLNLVAGSNGILGRASSAVDRNNIATAKEQVELKLLEWGENFYEEKYVERTIDVDLEKKDYVKDKIGTDGAGIGNYKLELKDDDKVIITDTRNHEILAEGTINEQGGINWFDQSEEDQGKDESTKIPATDITLTTTEMTLSVGESIQLTAVVMPTNTTDKVIWTTSDSNVVTVSENGVVTGVNAGTATITVTCGKYTATCAVSVPESLTEEPVVGEVEIPRTSAKEIPYNWEEIAELAGAIAGKTDTITDDTEEVAVSINGVSDTLRVGDTTKVDGKVVRILGFNHDELSDAEKETAYGGGHTYAGISFEYVDFLVNQSDMNNPMSVGWGECQLRGRLNSTIYDNLSIKSYIKEVKKEYLKTYNDAESKTTSNDKLWLLSCGEMWDNGYNGGETRGYAIATEGKIYQYYRENNATWDSHSSARCKPSYSNGYFYWLRSLNSHRSTINGVFCIVQSFGYCSLARSDQNDIAVAPGFSI